MKQFEGTLICTDLDGTLLGSDGKISKQNLEAIEYYKENGGYFTFITGRMPFYAQGAYEVINPNCPFGCNNGGALYDHRKGEYVWRLELEEKAIRLVTDAAKEVPGSAWHIAAFDRTYFAMDNSFMKGFREHTGVAYHSLEERPQGEPMAKLAFCDYNLENIEKVRKVIESHPLSGEFELIRSQKEIYEIMPIGGNKGTALKMLTELLNLKPSRTIAIGDYDNDVKMLEAAGCGVAVANAAPSAKAAADRITVRNDDHAIAQLISDLEQGKIF